MPYLSLDGLDITEDIEEIKWSENDLDAPNSGRSLDGMMQRGKVTSKRRADIKLRDLKAVRANQILSVLRNQYFTCETDLAPSSGSGLVMQMYNSTRSGSVRIVNTDGKVVHKDIAFNIIER